MRAMLAVPCHWRIPLLHPGTVQVIHSAETSRCAKLCNSVVVLSRTCVFKSTVFKHCLITLLSNTVQLGENGQVLWHFTDMQSVVVVNGQQGHGPLKTLATVSRDVSRSISPRDDDTQLLAHTRRHMPVSFDDHKQLSLL